MSTIIRSRKKVIGVIGARGKIGKSLINTLVEDGYEVIRGSRTCNNSNTEMKVDIFDDESLKKIVGESDIIVNCAGPTFIFKNRILSCALALEKDYVDAFGWTNGVFDLEKPKSRIVLNCGSQPGLSGVVLKKITTRKTQSVNIWSGGRENGGYGALGDIILSSINGYGKSNCHMINQHIVKDSNVSEVKKINMMHMCEPVIVQKYLSDESVQFARSIELPNLTEYKAFPDERLKNLLVEGCIRCMQINDVNEYRKVFLELLNRSIVINQGMESWFSFIAEAIEDGKKIVFALKAIDSSVITKIMLDFTIKTLCKNEIPDGIYWPYEILNSNEIISLLKKEGIEIKQIVAEDIGGTI